MAINLSKSNSLVFLYVCKLETVIVQGEHNNLLQRTSVPLAAEHCRYASTELAMAPTIHRERGFRFFFFSREEPRNMFTLSARKVRPSSGWSQRLNSRGIVDCPVAN